MDQRQLVDDISLYDWGIRQKMNELSKEKLEKIEDRLREKGFLIMELYTQWDYIESRTLARVINYLHDMGDPSWDELHNTRLSNNFPTILRAEYDAQYFVNLLTIEIAKRDQRPGYTYEEARESVRQSCNAAWRAWRDMGVAGPVEITRDQINYIENGTSEYMADRLRTMIFAIISGEDE